MSATPSTAPLTVSIQVGDTIRQIDVEDLYYHSTDPKNTSLTIDKEVLDAVESGSSEWINTIPVELTLPYAWMRIDGPYMTWPGRLMEGKKSHFLNGVRFSNGLNCFHQFIDATITHLRRLQAFLTEIDKAGVSNSDSDMMTTTTTIPLIEYKDVVFSLYRHYIYDGDKLSLTFSEHVGRSGWLNEIIWTRYFRDLLDREFPAYGNGTLTTDLTDVAITASQARAIRNYVVVRIIGLLHLLADTQFGSMRQNFRPDPVTGLRSVDFIDASFTIKTQDRQEYMWALDVHSSWAE